MRSLVLSSARPVGVVLASCHHWFEADAREDQP
jgi:hypothetical protein